MRRDEQSTVTIKFNYTGDGPTFLAPLPNIAGIHGGTSTIRIAGAFTDPAIQDSQVVMNVLEGNTLVHVPIELFDRTAPGSVSNFFSYFSRYSDQGGTVFHRHFNIDDSSGNVSLQGVQAGGFFFDSTDDTITAEGSSSDVDLLNEYSNDRPNDAGTLSFAKPSGAPDGATDEFFVNTNNANAQTLNVNNTGGFAVFGQLVNPSDLSVFQQILNAPLTLSTVDPSLVASNSALADLPLTGNSLSADNIFRIQSFTTISRDSTLRYSMTVEQHERRDRRSPAVEFVPGRPADPELPRRRHFDDHRHRHRHAPLSRRRKRSSSPSPDRQPSCDNKRPTANRAVGLGVFMNVARRCRLALLPLGHMPAFSRAFRAAFSLRSRARLRSSLGFS